MFSIPVDKIIAPILVSIIIWIMFNPSLLTFFSSSKSERLLLSKEIRIFHRIIICIICFFQIPLMICYQFLDGRFYNFFEKYLSLVLVIVCIGFIASWVFNYRFRYYSENKKIKEFMFFYIFVNIIYFPCLFFTYGFMILSLEFTIKELEFWANTLTLSFIYIFFLVFLYLSWKKLFYQEIKTEISLSDGRKISNCYFLHPTYGKSILLGDHPKQDLCNEIIVIPKEKIEYIQFTITHKFPSKETSTNYKSTSNLSRKNKRRHFIS